MLVTSEFTEKGSSLTVIVRKKANMPRDTKICVLELGMNSPGEIKKLSEIAKPNVGIITNIGTAHAANFKDPKNIAEEKSDIFSFFDQTSIAIIPFETDYYNLISKKASKKTNTT